MRGPFTNELWEQARPIYAAIMGHPFILGLKDGSLDEEKFRFYVVQDALYLEAFARALAVAASKAPRAPWILTFAEHARAALVVERALHEEFFALWGLTPEKVKSTPISPTNLAYTSYLLATAYTRPFPELLGALLPCYWIYLEVGRELERAGSPKLIYQKWINTYSSGEYAQICEAVLDMMDTVSERLTVGERGEVKERFHTSCRLEYMFWDSAYRLEAWPV